MRSFMRHYVRAVEAFNYRVGRFAMYLLLVMMAVLLWSSFTKAMPFLNPSLWTLEAAQFLLVAYYVLGGPYSIQLDANVRMDLLYSTFSFRRKAMTDIITVVFMVVYLGFLLSGGVNSLAYSLGHFGGEAWSYLAALVGSFVTGGPDAAASNLGVLERSRSVWRPVQWPIKLIFVTGVVLMLLQAVAELFKDIERWRTGDADPFGTAPGTRSTV
ncbi:TRAP transporter small permease subunit [Chthonobacter rhizosphaerae]|uniref:TRAP transporter small permease subunit n=1 Tax=Chthonobacter rhizosphaerae TaxID=2735553 RepID=UPI0015EFBA19|nr:TRAP transporter small permease subunit [Chthonobacter rhizosphaerae]